MLTFFQIVMAQPIRKTSIAATRIKYNALKLSFNDEIVKSNLLGVIKLDTTLKSV